VRFYDYDVMEEDKIDNDGNLFSHHSEVTKSPWESQTDCNAMLAMTRADCHATLIRLHKTIRLIYIGLSTKKLLTANAISNFFGNGE